MKKFRVNLYKKQYFKVDVTFIEEDKDEMDAIQIAMKIIDKDNKNKFLENETMSHEVEEIDNGESNEEND